VDEDLSPRRASFPLLEEWLVDDMKRSIISIFIVLSMLACATALEPAGVEMQPGEAAAEALFENGIGQPWVGGDSPSLGSYGFFSQYFWMPTWTGQRKHIEIPRRHLIAEEVPRKVYFNDQMQAVPYPQYQSTAGYTGGSSLWIQGSSNWSQYAMVPPGAGLSLLAVSASGGNGYLYEIMPDGNLSKESFYFFPGSSQINFYAEAPGLHILLFVIGSQASNAVVVDVKALPPVGPFQASPLNMQPQTYPPAAALQPAWV
jgi:hypothetical protein